MFSNLGKDSIIYGFDINGTSSKTFTGTIERVTPSLSNSIANRYPQMNPMISQTPEFKVDIVAIINGERREFQQVPGNTSIADFGTNSIVLAENKEILNNYLNVNLQNTINRVKNIDNDKALIPKYKQGLAELNPSAVNEEVVSELKEQVSSLQNQLAEALSLLKSENTPKVKV